MKVCYLREVWAVSDLVARGNVRVTIKEIGIIKLFAVNNSRNKRRQHQIIVCRKVSFVCKRNYLSYDSTDNGLPTPYRPKFQMRFCYSTDADD
jgi:hypothetical protein